MLIFFPNFTTLCLFLFDFNFPGIKNTTPNFGNLYFRIKLQNSVVLYDIDFLAIFFNFLGILFIIFLFFSNKLFHCLIESLAANLQYKLSLAT